MANSSRWSRLRRIAVAICFSAIPLVCTFPTAQPQNKILSVEEFKTLLAGSQFRFEHYKTANTWNGSRKPPILDTKFKRLFRTVLREAAKGNPNFDGKYVVASWGCGSDCQHFAIIDLETGIVTDGLTTIWGQVYRVDSSLLIVNDPTRFLGKGEDWTLPSHFYSEYYRWTGTHLQLLGFLSRETEPR